MLSVRRNTLHVDEYFSANERNTKIEEMATKACHLVVLKVHTRKSLLAPRCGAPFTNSEAGELRVLVLRLGSPFCSGPTFFVMD